MPDFSGISLRYGINTTTWYEHEHLHSKATVIPVIAFTEGQIITFEAQNNDFNYSKSLFSDTINNVTAL